jgi:hypothetical protein
MTHTHYERISAIVAVAVAALLGWFAHGFHELDIPVGVLLCAAGILLMAALIWEMLDV